MRILLSQIFCGAVILAFLASFSGCSLKVGERPPEYPIAIESFSCFSQISKTIEDYVMDRLNDTMVNQFIFCMQKGFVSFGDYTRGQKRDSFAPNEIRSFLQQHFLKDRIITDELLRAFMVIKKTLVGGAETSVTRKDLQEAVRILEALRLEAIRLRPFMRVLNPRLAEGLPYDQVWQQLNIAQTELLKTIEHVTLILQASQYPYDFSDFESFLIEFRRFIRWEEYFVQSHGADRWANLVRSFKRVMVSDDDTRIQAAEWNRLLESGAKWYVTYLRIVLVLKNMAIFSGSGLDYLIATARMSMESLRQTINHWPQQIIPIAGIDQLLSAVEQLHWLPKKIHATTLSGVLRPTLQKVLGNWREQDSGANSIDAGKSKSVKSDPNVEALGLRMSALENLIGEFNRWAEVQVNISKNLKSDDFFEQLKLRLRPLFRSNSQQVLMMENQDVASSGLRWDYENLTRLNWSRALMRFLVRGYSHQSGLSFESFDSGVTEDELQAFYEDYQPFGVELGLMDPRQKTSGRRAFLEGNLFIYESDGLDQPRMSFSEGVELIQFLYSGSRLSRELYQRLMLKCEHGPDDYEGNALLERNCVMQKLLSDLPIMLPEMPRWLAVWSDWSVDQRARYVQNLLTATHSVWSNPQYIEWAELSTFSMLIHYSEAILTRYNLSAVNSELDEPEVERAFGTFRGFIDLIAKRMCHELSNSELEGVFKYIVSRGEIPEANFDDVVTYLWRDYIIGWDIHLDRLMLSRVFVAFMEKGLTANSSANSCAPQPESPRQYQAPVLFW